MLMLLRRVLAELEETVSTYATSGLEAMAATARGAVLLAEDRAEEALPMLRDACRRWRELGAAYDAASVAKTRSASAKTRRMAIPSAGRWALAALGERPGRSHDSLRIVCG